MSDVQLLFFVLALLYAWECLCWLRPGSVAFTTWLGRNWRARHPGTMVGNDTGGFILAAPLPPLGTLLTANHLPISCSPETLLSYVSTTVNPGPRAAQYLRHIRMDQITGVRTHGKAVLLNGETFLRAGSPALARHMAKQLDHLRKLPLQQREAAISSIYRDSLNAKVVEQRWTEFQKLSKPVRLLANTLLTYLFALAPAVIWHLGFRLSWLGLLIGLIALTTTTAILFRRAHKKLFAEAEDERFTHTLTILLSPATATRGHDALSRPLFETFHPLAVAKVFMKKEQFCAFARRTLLDIRHPAMPACPGNDTAACNTERHSRVALQKSVEDFLEKHGFNPDELCRPPSPADESCRAYCPRCNAQFTSTANECMDCGGLPVVEFAR